MCVLFNPSSYRWTPWLLPYLSYIYKAAVNIGVDSIVITLNGDRWLLDVFGAHTIKTINVKSLCHASEANIC